MAANTGLLLMLVQYKRTARAAGIALEKNQEVSIKYQGKSIPSPWGLSVEDPAVVQSRS